MERLRSWFFVAALLALLVFGLFAAKDQSSTLHWPATPGRMESIDFVRVVTGVTKNGGTMHAYVPVVKYRYWVHGIQRQGKRLTPNQTEEIPMLSSPSLDQFRWFLHKPITDGGEVTVHYNPRDEADSYLFAWPSGFPICFAILPAVPLVIALLLAIRPEQKVPQGFWAGVLLSLRRHPALWNGLRMFLLLYPPIALLIYGSILTGPAVLTLGAHYAATLILPGFARFAGETLNQRGLRQTHQA